MDYTATPDSLHPSRCKHLLVGFGRKNMFHLPVLSYWNREPFVNG